jgi:vacuolar-type H+-ATPase subunit E/Vma4
MQMIAITERVDVEFQAVNDLMNEMKKEEDEKKLFELMRLIADKMSGIGIMREVLMNKFNKNYFPASKFEFLKLVYEVHTKMRKFGGAKDGRDRPKRGDEMAGQTHS